MSVKLEKPFLPTIGIVVPGLFIPPTDGGQRVCYDLCTALTKRTKVFCFSAHKETSLHSLNLFPLYSKSRLIYLNITLAIKLSRELKSHDVRFCIVNQPFFVFVAFLACKLSGCQLITYAHNLEFKRSDGIRRYLKPLILVLEVTAFHLSKLVFFISKEELHEARRWFQIGKERCIFVPHLTYRTQNFAKTKVTNPKLFTVLFFGNFNYPPNAQALDDLLQHIVPALTRVLTFSCRLIVFGKAVPSTLQSRRVNNQLSIDILGYVDNPANEIEKADVMLSPVYQGAGVQTKIIESLSHGTSVISSRSGARGIDQTIVEDKLFLVEDGDWEGYVNTICDIHDGGKSTISTPSSFYREYSEESTVERVMSALQEIDRLGAG